MFSDCKGAHVNRDVSMHVTITFLYEEDGQLIPELIIQLN